MTHDLIERGVPKEKIIPFPQDADNTKEEAEALRKLLQEKSWKTVIVVTSNYHTAAPNISSAGFLAAALPFAWPAPATAISIRPTGMTTARL